MRSKRLFRVAAFTLIEVLIGLGMFWIAAAGAISAMLRMNLNAALCRLQTGASTIAQNQIDLCLSDSPFNPQYSQVPPELTPGTTNTGSAIAPTIAIYTDPVTNQQVLGWMSTAVTSMNTTLNSDTLYLYQITVTVNYSYKGRSYSVSMCTMRTSDT